MKEEQRIPIGVYARAHFKLNFFFAFHVIFNCEKIIIIEHSRGDHSSARWPNICMAEYAREKRIAARHTHTQLYGLFMMSAVWHGGGRIQKDVCKVQQTWWRRARKCARSIVYMRMLSCIVYRWPRRDRRALGAENGQKKTERKKEQKFAAATSAYIMIKSKQASARARALVRLPFRSQGE